MTNPNIVFTAPNVAEVIDKPVPAPGPGQVLIRTVRTCISSGTERANLIGDPMVGTNVKDGAPAIFPRQAGYSASGVVEAVGEGVASVKPGDRVAASWTKHAAFNAVPEQRVYRLPDALAFEEAAWTECAAYATDLVTALKDEPGLLMWDVMNEPVQNPWIYREKDKKERQRRRERVWAFTRRACALVRRLDPGTPLTLGHTRAWEIEPTAEIVDVISFHDYEPTRAKMEYNFNLAESLGKKYGKPVINSEMGCLARANPYDMVLEECQRRGMGWIIYGHMIRRRSDNMHGVFYTDGTVRDPATVAAMMGCFRCRDTSVIIPGLANREGSARKAVDRLRRALAGVKPENSFTWRFASTRELLEASEHAANLLECCDLVPMAIPPTARIAAWRKMENPPWTDIRIFAYDLAKRLEKACELSQQEEGK